MIGLGRFLSVSMLSLVGALAACAAPPVEEDGGESADAVLGGQSLPEPLSRRMASTMVHLEGSAGTRCTGVLLRAGLVVTDTSCQKTGETLTIVFADGKTTAVKRSAKYEPLFETSRGVALLALALDDVSHAPEATVESGLLQRRRMRANERAALTAFDGPGRDAKVVAGLGTINGAPDGTMRLDRRMLSVYRVLAESSDRGAPIWRARTDDRLELIGILSGRPDADEVITIAETGDRLAEGAAEALTRAR